MSALRSLRAELRGAARLARRQVLFTSLLVVVLTLGIGASVAMFSVLNAVVLRPLPYGDPRQLMWLWSVRPDGSRGPFTIQDYVDLRERQTGSESVGAFAMWSANLTGVGTAERLQGMRTSANAFAVLRVTAVVGRTFLASDDAGERVVVVGHGLWVRRFGADPAVLGRVLTLNSTNYTIVGVLPRAFVFPIRDAELAVPIVEAEARRVEGDVGFLRLIARLPPDVSRVQAERLMTAVAGELQRLRPETNALKAAIHLTPLHEQIVGNYAVTLRLLLGAVLLVLVLACANLASLSLARTSARQRELACAPLSAWGDSVSRRSCCWKRSCRQPWLARPAWSSRRGKRGFSSRWRPRRCRAPTTSRSIRMSCCLPSGPRSSPASPSACGPRSA
jgi:putative ABC transport system permease protein